MAPNNDETRPLLGENGSRNGGADPVSAAATPHSQEDDILDFDPKGDVDNPLEWPTAFKWFIVSLLAFMAFTVTFTCISVVPIATRIVDDLEDGHASKSASVLLVTIWELGEAAGPLLIAPLSEIVGRYPVMNAANMLFIVATILAALCQSAPLLIGARALTGLSVAVNVLNPAIVGDMFVSEERGSPMSLIMFAPLIGGAVGPAISGAIAQTAGWRVVLWMSAGLAAVCEVLFLFCFRETYKVPILKKRAAKARVQEPAPFSGHASALPVGGTEPVIAEDDKTQSSKGTGKLWESMVRPAVVLSGSGVLAALSLFGAVNFAYFYIISVSLPAVLLDRYHLSPAETGSSFLSLSIGSFFAVLLCHSTLDRLYIHLKNKNGGVGLPEYRLPLSILGALFIPPIMALIGWIIELHLPLLLLLSALAVLGSMILLGMIPLMAYVVDACGMYSASALTAVIVSRCLAGTLLPLSAAPLVERFGYGWGFTFLGGVMLCLAPIPICIMRYGARWRQMSKYTRET